MHMTERIPFGKHYTEEQSLITLLQSRGLSITDVNKANHYLTHIGYYRLSAYMYPLLRMPKEQHLYKPGATFSKVMMLYRFDKKLRLLLFNEIEKIEVAVRSAIVKHGCKVTGDPFWMTNPNNFSNPVKFNKTIRLIEQRVIGTGTLVHSLGSMDLSVCFSLDSSALNPSMVPVCEEKLMPRQITVRGSAAYGFV